MSVNPSSAVTVSAKVVQAYPLMLQSLLSSPTVSFEVTVSVK